LSQSYLFDGFFLYLSLFQKSTYFCGIAFFFLFLLIFYFLYYFKLFLRTPSNVLVPVIFFWLMPNSAKACFCYSNTCLAYDLRGTLVFAVFCHRVSVESMPLCVVMITIRFVFFFVLRFVVWVLIICPTFFWFVLLEVLFIFVWLWIVLLLFEFIWSSSVFHYLFLWLNN
jgi:hypothetical protein